MEGGRHPTFPHPVHFCSDGNPHRLYIQVHHLLDRLRCRYILALEASGQTIRAHFRIPGHHPHRFLFLWAIPFLLELREKDPPLDDG